MSSPAEASAEIERQLEYMAEDRYDNFSLVGFGLRDLPDDLPNRIARLEDARNFRVTHLHLAGNNFSEVPKCLERMRSVEVLAIHENKIEVIPDWLRNWCARLKCLSISRNRIKRLPEWMVEMEALSRVSIDRNPLGDVDALPLNVEILEFLNLSELRLSEWPNWLRRATRLRSLALWDNKLASIPEWLFELKQLEGLNIDGNKIKEIPDFMARMKRLKELSIYRNEGIIVPGSVRAKKNCRILGLKRDNRR